VIGVRLLELLMPTGLAWTYSSTSAYAKFVRATGAEFGRLVAFFREVRAQAIPGNATMLLPEWAELYEVDRSLSEDEQRNLVATYHTAVGDQSFAYLVEQFRKAGFDVTIDTIESPTSECGVEETGASECAGVGRIVTLIGTVKSEAARKAVMRVWHYHAPLHVIKHIKIEVAS
jgi:uncharacterized protein YmfQ (DUF2313 family)